MRLRRRREPAEPVEDDEYERPRRLAPTIVLVVVAIAFVGTATTAAVRSFNDHHSLVGAAPPLLPYLHFPSTQRPTVQVLADPALLGDSTSPWWARLAAELPVDLRITEVSGGRYVGSDAGAFQAVADRVTAHARLVILLGDSGDGKASSVDIAAAASRMLARAHQQAPAAGLMVVGPDGDGTGSDRARAALRAAARLVDARWVDSTELERSGVLSPPVSSSAVAKMRLVDGLAQIIESSLGEH